MKQSALCYQLEATTLVNLQARHLIEWGPACVSRDALLATGYQEMSHALLSGLVVLYTPPLGTMLEVLEWDAITPAKDLDVDNKSGEFISREGNCTAMMCPVAPSWLTTSTNDSTLGS